MTRKLFLYKCNVRDRDNQRAFGDWYELFEEKKQPISWGGSWSMAAPLSQKILKDELHPNDLVLCWQTDLRGAVGLCRVAKLTGAADDQEIWLEAVDGPWDMPVQFTELKRSNPILGKASALQPGGGTLFRTTAEEAIEILKACGLKPSLLTGKRGAPTDQPATESAPKRGGAGFGKPDQNVLVEEAAVEVFLARYAGWKLKDRQEEKVGYDFVARKNRVERHVEVKGAKGVKQQFPITANEVARAKDDPLWWLFLVTQARSSSPVIHEMPADDFLADFGMKALSYMATRRKT